jgi:hypothetical protein
MVLAALCLLLVERAARLEAPCLSKLVLLVPRVVLEAI